MAGTNLQAAVSKALQQDPMLKNQSVMASTQGNVVTLSGTVETQQQWQQAETDAANVPGVSGVQNNLTVTGSQQGNQQDQAPPPPPDDNGQQGPPPPAENRQQPMTAPGAGQNPPPPPPDQMGQPAQQQPGYGQQGRYGQNGYGDGNFPPQQQVSGPVTIPAGTLLQVRLSEPINIAKVQPGTAFQATIASDVFEGNVLAIPRGAVVNGTVVDVKKAGSLGGNGDLQLQMTSLSLGGQNYQLATDLWSSKSPNKAGYTARNTAGGAVVGALIGGTLGRGPGAALGALVGGGAGMAASAGTNDPRLSLPPEAMLNFHLANAVTVQPVSWQEAQQLARNAPQLQRRRVYRMPYPYPYGYGYPYGYPYAYPYPYYRVYGW